MKVLLTALVAAGVLVLGAGCGDGSRDIPAPSADIDANDKRAVTLDCLRQEGFDAREAGEQSLKIDGPGGPRIEFLLSGGESEGQQFKGEAQGAEQIGSTLLFVGNAGDDELEQIEACVIG